MATEILAIGDTAEDSADVVVSYPLTVCLKDTAGPYINSQAYVGIFIKDNAGQYFYIDSLSSSKPAVIINGLGTYRFSRRAGVSCGVFSA